MPARKRTPQAPVTVTTPHPGMWAEALRQADGDARRIEIVTPTRLVVHPSPLPGR
jgi:hypothetical protein